uniref:Uncharacterized protein n=1 Tax=Dunaliella tertiolecta TaxID=3047 RepID=A0A7S3VV99_DUNTE|mmetsp:Transcript_14163/g.38355  ORF Transcript_14163/g.38355 Transcript_14163/m.38355 type:complete len:226 (+) Transcript_14163:56-733(+)
MQALCRNVVQRSGLSRAHLPVPRLFATQGGDQTSAAETRSAWNPNQQQQGAESCSQQDQQQLCADENSSIDSLPLTMRQVYRCLLEMNQAPGINCVVGDGLATVQLGLLVNNKKVALELEPAEEEAMFQQRRSGNSYVQSRVKEATLKAHDWKVAKVSEQRWKLLTDLGFSASGLPRGDDERDTTPVVIHAHVHYLKDLIDQTVGKDGQASHQHEHGSGCCGGSH